MHFIGANVASHLCEMIGCKHPLMVTPFGLEKKRRKEIGECIEASLPTTPSYVLDGDFRVKLLDKSGIYSVVSLAAHSRRVSKSRIDALDRLDHVLLCVVPTLVYDDRPQYHNKHA